MGEQNYGWFKVYHKASEVFTERDKYAAYIDLARRANLAGGSISTSISAIAREREWSRKKVRGFLSALQAASLGEIQAEGQERDTPRDTLTLVFSRLDGWRGTPPGTPEGQGEGEKPFSHIKERARAPVSLEDIKIKNKDMLVSRASVYDQDFQDFWKRWNYPKKSTKRQCSTWWEQNKPSEELQAHIIEHTRAWHSTTEATFMPDPIRYLKYHRWEDEIPDAHSAKPATGSSGHVREGFARLAAEARAAEATARGDGGAGDAEPGVPLRRGPEGPGSDESDWPRLDDWAEGRD